MLDSLRKAYHDSPLRPIVKSTLYLWRARSLRESPPWAMEVSGQIIRFATTDPYSHRWFYPRYANGRWHEPAATKIWLEAIASANIIVDVGANLGWFSCLAGALRPNARIIAFEPSQANRRLCQRNLQLNDIENATLDPRVVSQDESGVPWLENVPGVPHASNRVNCASRAVQMESISLDRYFRGQTPPDVIKIDVEGAEAMVLAGMAGLLRSHRPHLLLELHPQWLKQQGVSPNAIARDLLDIGYSLKLVSREGDLLPTRLPDDLPCGANGDYTLWAE